MRKTASYILMALSAVLMASCVKEQTETLSPGTFEILDNDTEDAFTLSATTGSIIGMAKDRGIFFIPVRSNIPEDEWEMRSDAAWCQIGTSISSQHGLIISYDANDDWNDRTANLEVSAGANAYHLSLHQFGYGPSIIVSNAVIGPEGGKVELKVTANIEYTVSDPAKNKSDDDELDWISLLPAAKAFTDASQQYEIAPNVMPYRRIAKVSVTPKDDRHKEAGKVATITQTNIEATTSVEIPSSQIRPVMAYAEQESNLEGTNGKAACLIDGDPNTYYHSRYGSDGTTTFPVRWEFQFSGENRIDEIRIQCRLYNGLPQGAGYIKEMDILYSDSPLRPGSVDEYTLLTNVDLGGTGGYQQIVLPESLHNVRWIMLSVKSSPSTHVSAGEVEFWSMDDGDILTAIDQVFTDHSCSQLKDGVTKQDIVRLNGISPFLAANVAMPMLEGTYGFAGDKEFEFRSWSYEPYSDNNLNKVIHVQKYTKMDNPTGILVKANTDILVAVDKIPAGQTVALAVYGEQSNGQEPNYGTSSELSEGADQVIFLREGLNAATIRREGLLYVYNVSDTPASAQKVKVHVFPGCGTAVGYWDLDRHDDARYKELLEGYSYKYFIIKGHKLIMDVHASQLKIDAPDKIKDAIETFDQIVSWEHELLGMSKYPYNNHMMVISSTAESASMLDAATRRVRFGVNALGLRLTKEGLVNNPWGPGHELGHLNQQAICWESTIESSNNLFSNYVMRMMHEKMGASRDYSRGADLSLLAEEYGQPWLEIGNETQYCYEDAELHMRMNWQLWLYYHLCGAKTDFFPTLFENLRHDPLPNSFTATYNSAVEIDPGACQLKYYEKVCETAGEDLTDFFDAWGFFVPVNKNYRQYPNSNRTNLILYRVTQQMIDEAKARVAAMNLPKAPAIQYIEDRTDYVEDNSGTRYHVDMGSYTIFQGKKTLSGTPSVSVNGRKVTLSNFTNAVAVELRNGTSADAPLVFFSNKASFEVPATVNLNTVSYFAVQYDGKRIKL